ncbi:putative mannosyltransferase [Talaromyces proteolyticus]|uniref:Mannosyltransferase n=1 Tax=Talaromyces proteolyticus TaxID=1131652 RepID=A0AAD4KUL3_9EURO|nr:putative mannosyltransferase [Talaromyces proteolyticus]KAH8700276.1 putative mannosyltransferase [Talaromyces proteolyticus]
MSLASSELSLVSSDMSSSLTRSVHQLRRSTAAQATPRNILLFLVAFRILNALSVRTFFQPDEFFQSLEPAWQAAFGQDSGAWITWEWKHELRSSIHPLFFTAVYYVTGLVAWATRLSPLTAADLLIATPKIAQAIIAAAGDYYTWKIADKVYGYDSYGAWATLALTVLSPWQWFCSTRTFSNCAETTLTVIALYFWPWDWFLDIRDEEKEEEGETQGLDNSIESASRLSRYRWPGLNGDIFTIMFLTVALPSLRKSLLLAAFACVLRPTNVLVWACLAGFAMYYGPKSITPILIRETVLCGSTVLGLSILIDRFYYGIWAFPFFKFLYINVAQSIAIFYGHNDWHYYLSQGFPLLLTTALPFGLLGLYQSLRSAGSATPNRGSLIKFQLASVCLFMPAVLSLIAHKEVRFIYPLLPALHVLAAEPLVSCYLPAVSSSSSFYLPRRLTLVFLVLVNLFIAFYTTLVHASGPVTVLSYLREQHVAHQKTIGTPNAPYPSYGFTRPAHDAVHNMSVGFLMPCHSTPWRSHLVFSSIESWALSCEPPVGLNETQKKVYLDEADQFYENPTNFLQQHMVGGLWHVPRRPSYLSLGPPQPTSYSQTLPRKEYTHEWPDYLVFFAQLEPTIRTALRSTSYAECWRTWSTAWHDDWRRKGDVVVWCLDPNAQGEWRKSQQEKHVERRDQQFERIISGFKKEAKISSTRASPWDISSFWDKNRMFHTTSTTTSWYSSLFNRWPFTPKRSSTSYLPSWLRNSWPTSSKKKNLASYLPKFLQSFFNINNSNFPWFQFSWPSSSFWPWNTRQRAKRNAGYPRIPEFERDLWN